MVRSDCVIRFLTLIALCSTPFLLSCSGDCPTGSDTPDEIYTTLNWVGTEVLYRPVEGKHDYSLLFVLDARCGYCQRLKRETLTDPDVIQILGESFNIAQIDFTVDTAVFWQDSTVSSTYIARVVYGVQAVPTIIILNYKGEEIVRGVGFREPDELITILEDVLDGRWGLWVY
ncbi:MAG TPA: thioredoxin fold domain-containing protein [Acidobacteriota bacterium]|nr:thioredoxin fold domain-containing protein [Acidobacteriota bacterium]